MNHSESEDITRDQSAWANPTTDKTTEVWGPEWVVGGYNALEAIERQVRYESMSAHKLETHLWYRALTLYFNAQLGTWDRGPEPITDEQLKARNVQMDLLGLGLSSAKSAIDSLLAGYYSVAFATIRHMAESILQCFYLLAFPETASQWYPEPSSSEVKTSSAGTMKDQLLKRLKSGSETEFLIERVRAIYTSWGLMSKGSHPTGAGLVQVEWPGAEGSRQIGGTYQRYMTLVGFDHGLFALAGLLEILEGKGRATEEWTHRFRKWRDDVDDFRVALKDDSAVQDFLRQLEAIQLDDGNQA